MVNINNYRAMRISYLVYATSNEYYQSTDQ